MSKSPYSGKIVENCLTDADDLGDNMNTPGKATLAELARLTVENADLKLEVHKLRAAIETAHFELSLEDVNADDCRADVLAILAKAVPQRGPEHE